VRVLHSDSVAHEADVLFALWYIACGVQLAEESGNPASMVDILSLSIGYYDETLSPSIYTGQVTKIIDWFLSMGVLIVAAAGNDSTSREFYPAALAARPQPSGSGPQLLSVGAQNPNGTNALFSNDGPWVRHWEPGAAVVSTYPIDVRGSGEPDSEPAANREGLDPDDFSAGFAVWDGTSFAAPLAAAKLAESMVDGGAKLGALDRDSTIKRAEQAAKSLT
jgi:subtilisin family serine protease